ncbi:MAG: hypothetical protein K6C06_06950, partial [Lachnospiraceae bacterium]|nr:hypothetical protein [Lachnospiraceae bacterium]
MMNRLSRCLICGILTAAVLCRSVLPVFAETLDPDTSDAVPAMEKLCSQAESMFFDVYNGIYNLRAGVLEEAPEQTFRLTAEKPLINLLGLAGGTALKADMSWLKSLTLDFAAMGGGKEPYLRGSFFLNDAKITDVEMDIFQEGSYILFPEIIGSDAATFGREISMALSLAARYTEFLPSPEAVKRILDRTDFPVGDFHPETEEKMSLRTDSLYYDVEEDCTAYTGYFTGGAIAAWLDDLKTAISEDEMVRSRMAGLLMDPMGSMLLGIRNAYDEDVSVQEAETGTMEMISAMEEWFDEIGEPFRAGAKALFTCYVNENGDPRGFVFSIEEDESTLPVLECRLPQNEKALGIWISSVDPQGSSFTVIGRVDRGSGHGDIQLMLPSRMYLLQTENFSAGGGTLKGTLQMELGQFFGYLNGVLYGFRLMMDL